MADAILQLMPELYIYYYYTTCTHAPADMHYYIILNYTCNKPVHCTYTELFLINISLSE